MPGEIGMEYGLLRTGSLRRAVGVSSLAARGLGIPKVSVSKNIPKSGARWHAAPCRSKQDYCVITMGCKPKIDAQECTALHKLLHRGDFRPGAALPSAAFPPQPVQRTPRSRVV